MSKKNFGTTIKKWLDEEYARVELGSNEQFEFGIILPDVVGKDMGLSLGQPRGKNIITITCHMIMPKEVTEIVAELKPEQKIKLVQALHRELLKIVQDHIVNKDLKSITFSERVYIDNLKRQRLMDSILKVRNVAFYLISSLRKEFGGFETPPPSTPDNLMYG